MNHIVVFRLIEQKITCTLYTMSPRNLISLLVSNIQLHVHFLTFVKLLFCDSCEYQLERYCTMQYIAPFFTSPPKNSN